MTDSERIRAILGISRAEFSRRYHIPVRTLEQWDKEVAKPPQYVLELLERAVRSDADALYMIATNRDKVLDVFGKAHKDKE